MASSIEAFERFERWKKSRTVLKVTVLTQDSTPDIHIGEISALDSDASVVCVTLQGSHDFFNLDLEGATFSIGKRKLEVERDGDLLYFEEIDV